MNRFNWTADDDLAGFKQGWGLFQRSDTGALELCKLDDPEGVAADFKFQGAKEFHDDLEAARFVQTQANDGNVVCRRAIEELIAHKSKDVQRFGLQKTW